MPTLLCERCGYDIRGLTPADPCPECGSPVADSLPERRIGSPWQRRPGLWSWNLTNFRAIRKPIRTFGIMRLDIRSGYGLAALNLLLAAALIVAPWSGVFIGDPVRRAASRNPAAAFWAISLQVVAVAVLLLLLTFFGWSLIQLTIASGGRGGRISRAAAWQVCAHSTVGWVVTAMTMWVALITWLNLIWLIPGLPQGGRVGDNLLLGIPLAGLSFGALIVALLLKVGAERCRFANEPAAAATPQSPELASPLSCNPRRSAE